MVTKISDSKQTDNKNQKMITSFAVIMAVVVIAVGITYFTHKKDSTVSITSSSSSSTSTTTSSTSPASSSSANYKDGSYTASGNYQTPGGQESISLSITIKNGTVSATSLQQNANNHDSREYQSAFASGYKSKVIGKALSSISLSRVSGSSLTSQGFNDALDQIKAQAAN